MLTVDLSTLFNARGIKRGFTFLRNLGLSSTVAHRLLHEDAKSIRLDHIFKICKELQCSPNDIIRLDGATLLAEDHPLQRLKKLPEEDIDIIEEINGVPLNKLAELKEVLDHLKK